MKEQRGLHRKQMHLLASSSPPSAIRGVRACARVCVRRHREVAREVLEASKVAADDPVKQFAMTFFDNKFNSLVPLKVTYFLR